MAIPSKGHLDLAPTNRLGAHRVRRRGLGRSPADGRSLALIATLIATLYLTTEATSAPVTATTTRAIETGDLVAEQAALRAALASGKASAADVIDLVRRIDARIGSHTDGDSGNPAPADRSATDAAPATAKIVRLWKARSKACYDLASLSECTLDDRLTWLDRSAESAKRAATPSLEVRARYLEATLLSHADRAEEAISVLTAALARHPDAPGTVYCEIVLSGLHRLRGNYAESAQYLERCSAGLASASDDQLANLGVLGCRIQLYLDLGLPDLAAPWVERERAAAERMHQQGVLGTDLLTAAQIREANLRYALGDYLGTIAAVDRFLENDPPYAAMPDRRAHLQWMKGMALLDLARREPARLADAKSCLTSIDDVALNTQDTLRLALAKAELCLRQQDDDGASAAVDAVAARGRPLSARDSTHVARVRAKIATRSGDVGERLDALTELSRTYDQWLGLWREIPIRRGGVGFLRKSSRRDVLSELIRLRVAIDPEEGPKFALHDVLRAQAHGSTERTEGVSPPSLDELRARLLSRGRGILLFLTAPDASHVFAIDEEAVVYREIAPEDELEGRVSRFVGLLSTPPTPDGASSSEDRNRRTERALSRQLCADLLPPPIVARVERWSGVTISTIDWLENLNFGCLTLPSGEQMGLRLPIDYLPSLPLGCWLSARFAARPAKRYDTELVIVTDARPSEEALRRWPEISALTLAEEPLTTLYAGAPADQVRGLRGDDATRQAVLEFPFSSTRVAQFLTHGVRDETRERDATLVLTGNGDAGLLHVSDVETLDAPRLVILTSCRSGSAPLRPGDGGTAGMARAWLLGGAQAVLHARAAIALEPTLVLSQTLHQRLRAGDSPALALMEARRKVAADPRYQAPFFYGLLRVEGLGQLPIAP